MDRLLPPTLVALLLGIMVALTALMPWPDMQWAGRAFGTIPLVLGGAMVLRNAQRFEQIGTNIKTFDDPNTLVRTGAFTWTRNPMYLGFLLVLAGAAIALGSMAALVGPFVFFVAADRWYIPFEERRMAATFGTDYDKYRSDVRRWIGPRAT